MSTVLELILELKFPPNNLPHFSKATYFTFDSPRTSGEYLGAVKFRTRAWTGRWTYIRSRSRSWTGWWDKFTASALLGWTRGHEIVGTAIIKVLR